MLCKVKGDPALPFEIEWEHNDEYAHFNKIYINYKLYQILTFIL